MQDQARPEQAGASDGDTGGDPDGYTDGDTAQPAAAAAAAGALAEILGRIETDLGATRRELAQLVGRVAEVEQGRLTAVGPVEIRLSPETVDQLAAAVAALGPAAVGPSAAEPTPVETPPAGPASPRPEPDDDPAGPLTLDDLDDPFLEALIRQEPLVA